MPGSRDRFTCAVCRKRRRGQPGWTWRRRRYPDRHVCRHCIAGWDF